MQETGRCLLKNLRIFQFRAFFAGKIEGIRVRLARETGGGRKMPGEIMQRAPNIGVRFNKLAAPFGRGKSNFYQVFVPVKAHVQKCRKLSAHFLPESWRPIKTRSREAIPDWPARCLVTMVISRSTSSPLSKGFRRFNHNRQRPI